MKVVVIEDEAPAARRLIKLIGQCDANMEVLTVLDSVTKSVAWFKQHTAPELIFSDIQLSDDLSFSIYQQLNITTPIIFTTAYDEYAIKAFQHHSIDYLLKPIRKEALQQSIEKFKRLQAPHVIPNFQQLFNNLKNTHYKSRFLVYAGNSLIPVPVQEVAYCYSEDGVTFLMTNTEQRHMLNDSLDQLEQQLDPTLFFRANRQFIVSIHAVNTLHPHFNQKLKLTVQPETTTEIIISKLKATAFKNWLNQ